MYRLSIAQVCLNVGWIPIWFTVHLIMLRIFIKYGKPLEEDEKAVIRDKLSFVFEGRSEQLTQSARRRKAYAEMADL